MELEQVMHLKAGPGEVYEFLLDARRVAECLPGVELKEVVDGETFRGLAKVKVGPVVVNYRGSAAIVERDAAARRAVLEAEGRERGGQGSVRVRSIMEVEEEGGGSKVRFSADVSIAGRVARFGRGVIEDVSRELMGVFASNLGSSLEDGAVASGRGREGEGNQYVAEPRPLSAVELIVSVIRRKLRRLLGRRD